jgi:hypothetical protein
MTRTTCAIALAAVVLGGTILQAQGGQFPTTMTNLQVWPKDTAPAVIQNFMVAFNNSLGVQCNYCHVQRDGRFDFASDDKREKRIARKMILLRDSINVMLAAIVEKPVGAGPTSVEARPGAPTRVLCASCHHGLPIPAPLNDAIAEAEAQGGGAAGLAKFKELRAKFYGGQQYDFTENALVALGNRALNSKRPADAIAYLQANLEYFPRSAPTYVAIAQATNAMGDKQGAIKAAEKALELNPQNAQARNLLQQLKTP